MANKLFMDSTGQSILTAINRLNTNLENMQGSLSDLVTEDKASLVRAINETYNLTQELTAPIREGTGAGLHNSIYRGKNLGSTFTDAQSQAIISGTFDDLWIGDYWEMTIDGTVYKFRIADFDYYYNCGSTALTTHHAVIVPDEKMYDAKMNDSATTDGGYAGSVMHKTNLAQAKTIINKAFGSSHILSHQLYMTNAVKDGVPSGVTTENCTVELMTEHMVYGKAIFGQMPNGSNLNGFHTYEKSQLSLFRLRHDMIVSTRQYWWLRDVVNASSFASVNSSGHANYYTANNPTGVRPAFLIA